MRCKRDASSIKCQQQASGDVIASSLRGALALGGPFRAAAHEHHGAVAARDLRLDPVEDEHAAVKGGDLAVARYITT